MSWANLPYDFDDRRPKVTAPKPARSAKYVAEEAAAFRQRAIEQTEQEREAEREKRRKATKAAIAGHELRLEWEYTSRGLTPYRSEGVLVSLPFLLSIGWSIESDGMGRNVLVKPVRA